MTSPQSPDGGKMTLAVKVSPAALRELGEAGGHTAATRPRSASPGPLIPIPLPAPPRPAQPTAAGWPRGSLI